MNINFTDEEILSNIPGYPNNVNAGDTIMPQNVSANLGISTQNTKKLFEDLAERGLIVYDEGEQRSDGTLGRMPGWRITQKGVDVLFG